MLHAAGWKKECKRDCSWVSSKASSREFQGMAIVDKERKRADAAELEVQRLKAELEELKKRLADS